MRDLLAGGMNELVGLEPMALFIFLLLGLLACCLLAIIIIETRGRGIMGKVYLVFGFFSLCITMYLWVLLGLALVGAQ